MPSEACAGIEAGGGPLPGKIGGWLAVSKEQQLHLKQPTPPEFVRVKDTYVSLVDQMWARQERGPTRSNLKGTLPKRATWTDNGPISGTGGFQKTGVEGATGNSKAEV